MSSHQLPTDNLMDTHCVSSDQLPTGKLVDTHVCHLTNSPLTNWWTFMVCHLTGSPMTTSWWTLMVCHLTISPVTNWWTLMGCHLTNSPLTTSWWTLRWCARCPFPADKPKKENGPSPAASDFSRQAVSDLLEVTYLRLPLPHPPPSLSFTFTCVDSHRVQVSQGFCPVYLSAVPHPCPDPHFSLPAHIRESRLISRLICGVVRSCRV